jgi:hypothetical protein
MSATSVADANSQSPVLKLSWAASMCTNEEVTMSIIVLVPGAWHGAWCWERVTPSLAAAGHKVLTPELLSGSLQRFPVLLDHSVIQ